MEDDLKYIKKIYGEKMMHLCRMLFPSILEKPGTLIDIMLKKFEPYRFLYDDLIEGKYVEKFKDFIFNCFNQLYIKEEEKEIPKKSPFELLDETGYTLYECRNEKDIQSFKKYYSRGEELCTFNGGRLNSCHVFFAVKKDVNKIKREDFKNPERQDEYGTSVISIQFTRGKNNTLSIKNRYNHTVNNPDATFSNNLDNIIDGLTLSFEKFYNLNISNKNIENFDLRNYVKASDGKFYKYNCEINNIYYCPNNIIIDNYEVKRDYQQMERFIILDYFIIDLKEKTIKIYDNQINDSFINDLTEIEKIDVIKSKETGNKEIIIYKKNKELVKITIDHDNNIVEYDNQNINNIKDNFLQYNQNLKQIDISNALIIGNNFLCNNRMLEKIVMPKVITIGNNVLEYNQNLKQLDISNALTIGNNFLCKNEILEKIKMLKVITIGNNVLLYNKNLKQLDIPNTESIGNYFLYDNEILEKIEMSKVITIGEDVLRGNKNLKQLDISNALTIGNSFLCSNEILEKIEMLKVNKIGDHFLSTNKKLKEIIIPEITDIGNWFITQNEIIEKIEMSNVIKIGDCFLGKNRELQEANFPKVETIGEGFLYYNEKLKELKIPSIKSVEYRFLENNKNINKINPIISKILPSNFTNNLRANYARVLKIKKIKLTYKTLENLIKNFIETKKSKLNISKGIKK